jgi:hypothetical protein
MSEPRKKIGQAKGASMLSNPAVQLDDEDVWQAMLRRLRRDLRDAAKLLTEHEVRFLVDTYYEVQHYRLASSNQQRALTKSGEPILLVELIGQSLHRIEKQIIQSLDAYSQASSVGRWSRSIVGIGPVLAAGLLAHVDITKASTAGQLYRFAGYDPTVTWGKGEKRPWNARLKTLCYKIGDSFVKFCNHPDGFYGQLYQEQKKLDVIKNERGIFAPQAAEILKTKRFKDETGAKAAYEAGRLPLGHLHMRALRWTIKLFLSHYQEAAFVAHYGELPPFPYPLVHLNGHSHYIPAPNREEIPRWKELRP